MSTVTIAPHLWRALELMSKDMGVESSALCNQAVFAWLRINGYVLPGTASQLAQPTTPSEVLARAEEPPLAAQIPAEPPTSPEPMAARDATPLPAPPAALRPPAAPELPPLEKVVPLPPEPVVDPGQKVAARIQEIDEALAALTHPRPAWAKPAEAPEARETPPQNEPNEPEAPSEQTVGPADTGDDTQSDPVDPRRPPPEEITSAAVPVTSPPPAAAKEEDEASGERTVFVRPVPLFLFIERENSRPIRVVAERFTIGRGPQCNLVIDSPRVSREHVAITRQGAVFVLDDLGSSNGTWFNAERVTRKELENGDTILLGNEAVTFSIRQEE